MKYRNKLNKSIAEINEYYDARETILITLDNAFQVIISKKDFLEFFEELEVVYEYRFVYQASEKLFSVSPYHTTDEAINLPEPREAILFTKRIREQ